MIIAVLLILSVVGLPFGFALLAAATILLIYREEEVKYCIYSPHPGPLPQEERVARRVRDSLFE